MKLLHRADRGLADAIISEPEDHTVMDTRGGVRSIQAANVSMPARRSTQSSWVLKKAE